MADEMDRDERVFLMGTRVPPWMEERFGAARVRRTPIAESAMTGMAIGAAGSGFRPIVAWNNISFSFVAFDQVVNQAARIRYMFGAQREFPIVFRGTYANGTRSAAQHSQTAYALYAHAGGLKIIVPSNAGRREGPAAVGDPRRQPGDAVRGGAPQRHARRGPRRARAARRRRRPPPRDRRHRRRDRLHGRGRARGGRARRGRRGRVGRGDRSPHPRAARHRDGAARRFTAPGGSSSSTSRSRRARSRPR